MKSSVLITKMKSALDDDADKKMVTNFIKKLIKADREQYVVFKVKDLANDLGLPYRDVARSINLLNQNGFLLFKPTFFLDGMRLSRKDGMIFDEQTGEVPEKYETRLTTSPLGLALQ